MTISDERRGLRDRGKSKDRSTKKITGKVRMTETKMQNLLRQLRRNRKKPLIFGLFGAAGCLVTEISLSEVYSVSRKGEV